MTVQPPPQASSGSTGDDAMRPFDRAQVRRQRQRAAAGIDRHDFLYAEIADRLLDRLGDTMRRFPVALDLGCGNGILAARLAGQPKLADRVGMLVQCDGAPAMARSAARAGLPTICADEELLPFAPNTLDLVFAGPALHAVNDLPGTLIQLQRALRPDGLLLAALFGGRTLHQLRDALLTAEAEISSGASPRVAPFVDIREAGGLMQRAGFALPVVDGDEITVLYADAFALMHDLRGMAMGNALRARRRAMTARSILMRAVDIYRQRHATADGRITASFEIVFLHGWKPAHTQQRPLRPGSAGTRLADALETVERSAGDKAKPR